MKNKTILIIGINSFIAQALQKKWSKKNKVIGIHHYEDLPKDRVDIVVNCACPANPNNKRADGRDVLFACSVDIFTYLIYIKKHDSMFVQISSTAVNEPDAYEPYRVGKEFAEVLIRGYDVDSRIVRLRHTYGRGMPLGDGRVHSNMLGMAKKKDVITYWGDGKSVRTFTYIDDVVSGIENVIEKGNRHEIYEVSHPKGRTTMRKLALTIGKITGLFVRGVGKCPVTITPKPDIQNTLKLGWKPKYDLVRGLREAMK